MACALSEKKKKRNNDAGYANDKKNRSIFSLLTSDAFRQCLLNHF